MSKTKKDWDYLYSENEEVRQAYVAGFLKAERLNGYLPTSCNDILNHVRQQVLLGEEDEYQTRRREARILLGKYGYNKAEFRAMMLNCESVDDAGNETSLVDDEPLRDGDHYDYRITEVFLTEDDMVEVPYMELKDRDDRVVCRVYKNDKPFIDEMLARDMAIGDPINSRYLREAGPCGLLEGYKEVVYKAWAATYYVRSDS